MAESVDNCELYCVKRKLVLYSTSESNDDEFADSGSEYIPSEEDNSSNSDVNETVSILKLLKIAA